MKYKDLKPGNHFVIATEGMRGHFACEMWINNEDADLGPFPEPWQSDFMTYENRSAATLRAKQLADEENLPYVE